ncbi:MAG TPA: YCF48-related protein [Bacteroidota bacterium]|nr:YCF48-related protein [Bacteroidota bacterium]
MRRKSSRTRFFHSSNQSPKFHRNKRFLLFLVPALFVFLTSGAVSAKTGNWSIVISGNGRVFDISFPDTSYGWAVGDSGRIMRTTNGGTTWINQSSPTGNDLQTVSFPDRNVGYAAGIASTLLKTTNGGMSWGVIASPVPADWSRIYFRNDSTGWLVSPGASNIEYTTDGGASWTPVGPTTAYDLTDLWFLPGSDGWAAGGYDLLHTTDGVTWNSINSSSFSLLNAVSFPSDSTGYCMKVTYQNSKDVSIIFRTTDAGQSWDTVGIFPSVYFHSLSFITPAEGWVAGDELIFPGGILNDGAVYHTSDAGGHWTRVLDLDTGNHFSFINRVLYKDAGHGWVGGSSFSTGIYQRMVGHYNGPTTLVREGPPMLPSSVSLEQNYPNPFNPSTTIRFSLPRASRVVLTIFDITGREVARLVDATLPPGVYLERWNAMGYASGMYYYRLTAGTTSATKPMVLMK